ncbi:c-type cytochrome [Mesorhizobium muleiense]|uniref:Cytochrome c, mono-and diheme variants n=2 Tax=Mesorhizobium TaxID=68287 RepID=A0A1G8JR45_9HYPH|nr:c-type cytochrome [Mesorhizobium muleiense]MCF6100075.1 c-type cytochrome [Mesorhizobium muleiense]SDI33652.1 Cytochrome c, mono-and diheme variants [Mesorhizobium muleiense]
MSLQHGRQTMSPWFVLAVVVFTVAAGFAASSQAELAPGKFYEAVGNKVDARTYNGFRRYHGSCNHCHGPDGMGSTFASALVDRLPGIEVFRRNVRDGVRSGASVMKGFADDPNVAPYIDDIYAYLQARADGALGRGRPERLEN